jgi:RNA:NAD 2'-phosphotransferase (TPT1/KptA family)
MPSIQWDAYQDGKEKDEATLQFNHDLYDASVAATPVKNKIPDVLYHGTLLENIDSIKRHGLIGMSARRPFVTLKKDIQEAEFTAMRHANLDAENSEQQVIVLGISVKDMIADGCDIKEKDYGFGIVWEVDFVPIKYISIKM